MDIHPVPFPTTHHHEDPPSFVPERPPVPPRLHSTPSLPNLGHPHNYVPPPFSFTLQGPARHRPHLRPLDLASSPPSSSPTKKDHSFDYLRRPSTLLTPPLTPSSSFNSNTNDTPSTPPEPHSPRRYVSVSERERVFATAHSAYSAGLKGLMNPPNSAGGMNAGYLTPTSARSQSTSSDDGPHFSAALATTPDASALASGLASAEMTPRDERTFVLDGQETPVLDLGIGEASTEAVSRLIAVHHVPRTAPSNVLLDAFSGLGDVKGILARFQASHGVVILAFYDTRHAARALRQIAGHKFSALDDVRLEAAYISPTHVEKLTGKSDFVSELDGSFFVTVEGRAVMPKDVQKMLASFGELTAFSAAGSDPCDQVYSLISGVRGPQSDVWLPQTFHVDFCDCRDASNAHKALNNRTILGARLTLISSRDALEHPARLMQNGDRSASPEAALPHDIEGRMRPRSVSASEGMGTPDAVRRLRKAKGEASQDHGRRPSNDLFFDAVGRALDPSAHPASSRPRSTSASAGAEILAPPTTMQQPPMNSYLVPAPMYPYAEPPYGYAHPGAAPAMYAAPGGHPYHYTTIYAPDMRMHDQSDVYWTYAAHQPPQVKYYLPAMGRGAMYPPLAAQAGSSRVHPQSRTPELQFNESSHPTLPFGDDETQPATSGERASDGPHGGGGSQRVPGSKNIVDIAAIESGVDTRTTVMIKNIPNKMSDKDLFNFINRVCPRRFDFMYLRMDFQNGCNVGYAFVNFITVQDLLHFAKTQLGVKWNMYSSEKVLQMCYATYQGKESLVEKFKNSCIMDEREAWRPKIFYSDGPNQGLPEPFPPATHLRRKERSQNNRGALFVPGTHHQPSGGGGGGLYHHRPHPLRMSAR
ncbi:hypothetical protein BV20DRAFT_721398 [Pilatotrama ljubarskyi]|nr:hypothetical protein BV20DRAFT_721398 [Pilatotrama ljubarskyi]